MKGKFDAYVLWPLAKKFQNLIVDQSTARDFTVCRTTALINVHDACSAIMAINAKLTFYGIPKHYKPTVWEELW